MDVSEKNRGQPDAWARVFSRLTELMWSLVKMEVHLLHDVGKKIKVQYKLDICYRVLLAQNF